mmetsp:Transcript_44349/g.44875  ORF Transcript_44349/g.44875 Transcript_44349/m.44875 type:complete len:96 (-) Transcript_44349:450-737(-)
MLQDQVATKTLSPMRIRIWTHASSMSDTPVTIATKVQLLESVIMRGTYPTMTCARNAWKFLPWQRTQSYLNRNNLVSFGNNKPQHNFFFEMLSKC